MKQANNPNQYRKERLEQEVRKLLSPVVQEFGKERGFIASVSDVHIDDIRKGAVIWLSVIAGNADEFLKLIKHRQRNLEGLIFTSLPLPFKLNLDFYIDTGPAEAQHIADLINTNS